jgi:FkbM family methyltransferase
MIAFTPLIGRFGNQLFQYAHTRAVCEQNGYTLATPEWVGERIFEIPEARRAHLPDLVFSGYNQDDASLVYSRRWILNTLRLRPEIQAKLDTFVPQGEVVAHVRRGDYADLQYALVSQRSYFKAAEQFGFNPTDLKYVCEEASLTHPDFTGELSFLPDFYRMLKAKVLFRGNSSFSWFAGTLGEARVFSPCIKDKPGGVESDCEFSEGNHERLCNLPGFTDLHLFREEQRYEYDLKPDDLVIDIGGYNGDFAEKIHRKYGCFVHIYEPCGAFFDRIASRFHRNLKVNTFYSAVSRKVDSIKIHIKGDMTGVYADGPAHYAPAICASTLEGSALLKINCEGGEYDILEALLECGSTAKHRNIQVQFHRVGPDYARRYSAIREGLLKTHRLTFSEPFCWENFELRA